MRGLTPAALSRGRAAQPVGVARIPLAMNFWLAAALVMLGFAPSAAAQSDLATLFPQQAPIYVEDANLSRLDLPVGVLAVCSADFSDLRILDAQGNEVPYLLDGGPGSNRAVEVVRRYALEIVDVERTQSDREDGPAIYRERYVLSVPAEVTAGEAWDLIVETKQPEYVRRVRVAVIQDGSETDLVNGGSLFRLTNPLRERSRVTLPRFAAPRLAVEIEGEDGRYLEPVFQLETSATVAAREQTRVMLAVESRREEGRRTVIELERARGVLADSLTLRTSTGAFSRTVEVWDEGPGASNAVVGRKDLYRVQAAAAVEDLEIPLRAITGNRLRVVIENGDSPPLAELSFVAQAQPRSLLFTLTPRGEDAPAGRLLFGGGRGFRPQYDLERLRGLLRPPRQGEQARVASQLYVPSAARLGPITENPDFGAEAVLSFAMRPGGAVDARLYSHRRTLRLDPSDEGLSRLTLTLEDLAQAQPDLRDVRIVDGESRQWAYLAEHGTAQANEVLAVARTETEDGVTEYELALPAEPATFDQITLETETAFFDREFELISSLEDRESSHHRSRIRRRAGDSRPIVIPFAPLRVDSLRMRIHDGNDAPLVFRRIEGRFPLAQIYVAAPAGEYTLLMGNPDDQPPSYEISSVSAAVLAVRSNDASVGPLEGNPEYSAGARLATGSGPQQVLLWVALILVVGVLAVVTLRMVRQQPGADGGTGGTDAGAG